MTAHKTTTELMARNDHNNYTNFIRDSRKRPRSCIRCLHGAENFWGYIECWHFNKSLDFAKTTNTAVRERQAYNLNRKFDCSYFERIQLQKSEYFRYYFYRIINFCSKLFHGKK